MAVPEGAGKVNYQEERSETLFATSLPMLSTAPCDRPGSGWQLGFRETAEGRCFASLLFLFLLLLLLLPKLLSLLGGNPRSPHCPAVRSGRLRPAAGDGGQGSLLLSSPVRILLHEKSGSNTVQDS